MFKKAKKTAAERMTDDALRTAIDLESICPAHAEAKAMERRLLAAAAEAERTAANLYAELSARVNGPVQERLNDDARRLIEGEEPEDHVGGIEGLRRRLAVARHQQKVARRAIDLHREEDRTLHEASVIACENVRPEYERTLRDTAHAVIALITAQLELERVRDTLEASGVRWVGKLPQPQNLGNFRDSQGKFSRFLDDAINLGLIDPADHPLRRPNTPGERA